MRGLIVGLIALGIGTCACLDAEGPPDGAYEVRPDSMWVAQYHAAEHCTGLRGDVSRVRWYIVPGRTEASGSFKDEEGNDDLGQWIAPHHVYIAQDWRRYEWIARHEAIHDLRQSGGHPAAVFGAQCRAMWGEFVGDDHGARYDSLTHYQPVGGR